MENDVFKYSREILEGVKNGALITTKANGKINTMSIAWGFLGVEWNRPIFVALVREGRHTKSMLDAHGEFTINVPYGEYDKKIISYCGTKSGKDVDKVNDLNLTLIDGINVDVPAIKELPLTIECKVIFKQFQKLENVDEAILSRFYPSDVDSDYHSANKDYHYAFYGEVVNAYILD